MHTNIALVAVIGLDQPGVIACVSSVLTRLNCNIQELTQTTLNDQFAGIYLVNKPKDLDNDLMTQAITDAVNAKKMHLTVITRDYEPAQVNEIECAPFVISVYGPDRNDIIGTFAHIFGENGININALRAFPIDHDQSMQVFEVMIPTSIDMRSLHRLLQERANAMNLHLTLQHRDIFEAIHRVAIN